MQSLLLAWLDSLFVLAKSTLVLANPDTYDAAFSWLERGWTFLQSQADSSAYSTHLRILSGAFYSLSGTLYRAGRYSFASRFLERGCVVGALALKVHSGQDSAMAAEPSSDSQQEKDAEAWRALQEGLYKRWEVLGVCHSKTGDRKVRGNGAKRVTVIY